MAAQQHGEPVEAQVHMTQQQQEYDQMMLEGLAVVEQEESNVHHPGRQLVLLALPQIDSACSSTSALASIGDASAARAYIGIC